jgi:hypothetical protein
VLFRSNWAGFFNATNIGIIKSKCKKYFSFLECEEPSDHAFVFDEILGGYTKGKYTVIPAPYTPSLYPTTTKVSKTIVLDHFGATVFSLNLPKERWHEWDFTQETYKWLEPLSKDYQIYGLYGHDDYLKLIPSYITPVRQTNFEDYIKFLSTCEQFINQARNTYGYTIIDMAVLGARISSYYLNYLPKCLIQRFNIFVYKTQKELIDLLIKPIDSHELSMNVTKCTPMGKVVDIVDSTIQRLFL